MIFKLGFSICFTVAEAGMELKKACVLYFLHVLLISECARMRVLIEGGNKTRAGSINVTTLLCSCASNSFSTNKIEV